MGVLNKKYMELTLVFTREPEGGYTVEVVELPGCISYGETIEEAEEMIQDAAQGYLISLRKRDPGSFPLKKKHSFISSVSLHETI